MSGVRRLPASTSARAAFATGRFAGASARLRAALAWAGALVALAAIAWLAGIAARERAAPTTVVVRVDPARRSPAFPELRVETLDRGPVVFGGAGPRVVLLNVWATWCGPCRREMPALQRLAAQGSRAARFDVRSLSIDESPVVVREWLVHAGVDLPVLIDAGGREARTRLRVDALPQTFVLDRAGRIRARIVGARDWDAPGWLPMLESLAD